MCMVTGVTKPRTQVAFLLAQLGAYAAEQFGERAGALDLSRPESGLLRLIGRSPGQSQRAIAAQLGTPPSRLVALVDGLEDRGLVERRRSATDRRNHELHLTGEGSATLSLLGQVAAEHEAAMTEGLTSKQKADLESMLRQLADRHGLTPGIHPGYQRN